MRIGKVIGTVTLSRSHPSLAGASYRLVVSEPVLFVVNYPCPYHFEKSQFEVASVDEMIWVYTIHHPLILSLHPLL